MGVVQTKSWAPLHKPGEKIKFCLIQTVNEQLGNLHRQTRRRTVVGIVLWRMQFRVGLLLMPSTWSAGDNPVVIIRLFMTDVR